MDPRSCSLGPLDGRPTRRRRSLAACALSLVVLLGGCASGEPSHATSNSTETSGQIAVPAVDVRAFAVYDVASGRVLASHHADDRLPVGSLMKLLNAYVAYEAGAPGRVTVAPDDLGGGEESLLGIRPGTTITRGVLIRAMLKVSANDAARLLALDIAGSEARYVGMMNAAADDLGLEDTHAVNASGLDADGQHSTANDLIHLGVELLRNDTFRATVGEHTASFEGRTIPNTNVLLGAYEGADGIKTGHTPDAGWCILASATRGDRRIVVAVLGAPTEGARDAAARALLDWGFAQGEPDG